MNNENVELQTEQMSDELIKRDYVVKTKVLYNVELDTEQMVEELIKRDYVVKTKVLYNLV